jgi:hypothetical protein
MGKGAGRGRERERDASAGRDILLPLCGDIIERK